MRIATTAVNSLKRLSSTILPIALLLVGISIAYRKVLVMRVQGPGWDVFAFLANALQFAGKGIGYWEPHRPPFLSFLTSFFFRVGFVSETAIFIADGVLFVSGLIGLYLLLNRRFDPVLSFLGSLFFSSILAVVSWAATGMSDVPSVSLSIWTIYLFVMAVEVDTRYYWLAWPTALIALLTRFTAGLILVPIILILLTKGNVLRGLKHVVCGMIASIAAATPYFYMNLKAFGDILFPLTIAFGVVTAEGEEFTSPEKIDKAWYVLHLRELVASHNMAFLFYALIVVVFAGLLVYAARTLSQARQRGLAVVGVVLALGAYALAFSTMGLLIRQISIFLVGLILFFVLRDARPANRFLWLDIAVLSWFLVYFDFHSHVYPFQRYFVTMAPALTYFVVLGLSTLIQTPKHKFLRAATWVATSIMLVLLFLDSFIWVFRLRPDEAGAFLMRDIKQAAQWLRETDPDIASRTMFSDSWVDYSWYLRQDVKPMPFFQDKRAAPHELEKYRVDYYLTLGPRDMESFDLVGKFGKNAYVYRGDLSKFHVKPRILYIGQNWQHYFENVTNFKYFLIYEGGKYGTGKSIFIDNYTLPELKRYPVVLLYNFKWHNRKKAESLLRDYVKEGGKIIIDATANASGLQHNLEGDSFLGVIVLRTSLPAQPTDQLRVRVANEADSFPFSSGHDGWLGATYQILPGNPPIKNLASIQGDTLIGKQSVGKGAIYWLGYNLVWHAFTKKSKEERNLIVRLVETALGKTVWPESATQKSAIE